MCRSIQPTKLSLVSRVACKTIPGAKVGDAFATTKKLANKHNVSEVVFHLGTNNIEANDPSVIATQLESLGEHVLSTCESVTMITISSIVHRRSPNDTSTRNKINEVNAKLREITRCHAWGFIDHSDVDVELHLTTDGLHFNPAGAKVFVTSIKQHINKTPALDIPDLHKDQRAPYSPLYEAITSPSPLSRSYSDVAANRDVTSNEGGRPRYTSFRNTRLYSGCYNCGEKNHKQKHCRYGTKIQCFLCREFGHKSKFCELNTHF